MNFILVLLLILTATFNAAAQTLTLEKTEPSVNGYPMTALPGSERREWIQPIFERDHVTAWVADSTGVTFTTPGNHLQAGDTIRLDNFTSYGYFTQGFCTIRSADSSSFQVIPSGCNMGLPSSGSGTETTGVISVVDGPGRNSKGTWEVYATTGTESFYVMSKNKARFAGSSSCTMQLAVAHDPSCYAPHPVLTHELSGAGIYIEIGQDSGSACSFTGSIATGNLQIHSTKEFDVKFTSDQDASQSHVEHYVVCKPGAGSGKDAVVFVDPGYMQVYKNFSLPLFCQVFGNSNQLCHFSIVSAPPGGDATLDFPDSSSPIFNAKSVGGGYMIQACADTDPTACQKQRIWVAKDQTPPAGNVDKVIQIPCEVDTAMSGYGGEVWEVGPGQAYPDLRSLPTNAGQWHWGLTVRWHNEGSQVGSPNTIHQYWAVNPPANIGPSDGSVPMLHICGIPNPQSGELPVEDGQNATGNSWLNTYTQAGATLLSISGASSSTVYDGNELASNHSLISGIRFQNVTAGISYTKPDGNPSQYGSSSAIRFYGNQHFAVAGTRAITIAMPYFSDCNPQTSGWRNCSLDAYYFGNHCEGYGIAHQSTEHCFYEQSLRTYILANFEEGSASGDGGATGYYSMRGSRSIYAYNFGKPKAPYDSGSGPGGDSEIQDAYMYFALDAAFGPQGLSPAAGCSLGDTSAPFCPTPANVVGGVDTYAAFQEEHFHTFFNFSNVTFMSTGANYTGIAPTHDVSDLRVGVNEYVYHNTNRTNGNYPISLFEDLRNFRPQSPGIASQPVQWPAAEFQNNDLWNNDNRGCSYGSCGPSGKWSSTTMINYHTNVVKTGQYTIATGLTPTLGWAAGSAANGLNTYWDYHDYGGTFPIESHIGGWDNSNFIESSADPVSSSTFAPNPGSADIGAASALTWPMNWYPPRFNAVNPNMDWTKRADLTTAGAYDPVGAPTPVSITLLPNPISLIKNASVTLSCTTKLSDGSSRSCFSTSCQSSNTASATVSGLTVTATSTTGTGTISCTAEGLPATTDNFTVNNPPLIPLEITANNATRAYGLPNPSFSGSVTGAVNGDTFTLSFTTTANSTSNTGTYSIVPAVSGSQLANYSVTATNGILTITKTSSTTSLSVPSKITLGTSATLTATVPSAATGTVVFYDGSATLGTGTITHGTAVLTTSSIPLGSHNITATYGGDANFTGSTSSSVVLLVVSVSTPPPSKSPSKVTLSVPSEIVSGASATLTATVTSTATGTVTFYDGTVALGTASVINNTARLIVSSLSVGRHTITATYSGDANFNPSTSSTASLVVNKPNNQPSKTPSKVTLDVPAKSVSGSSVIIRAYVTRGATGTVTFYDGSIALSSATIINGNALLTISALPVGTHHITAAYSGDANFAPSTSSASILTITEPEKVPPPSRAPSTVRLSMPSEVSAGNSVTLTAVVTSGATGRLVFYDGSRSLGTTDITNGNATLTVPALSSGSHTITASYNGDSNFSPATSPAAVLVVMAAPVSADFKVSNQTPPQLLQTGDSVSYTILVSSVNQPFTNAVALAASNLPPGTTYSYSPANVTPGSSGATSSLKISMPRNRTSALQRSLHTPFVFAALMLPFAAFKRLRRSHHLFLWFLLAVTSLTAMTGCGGGQYFNQPLLKPYTVTVQVSSGNLVRSTTIELTVQ